WQLAHTLARFRLGSGDAAGAQKYLRRAARSPDLPDVGPETVEVLRGLAVLSAGLQRMDDAAEAYARLVPFLSGEKAGLDFTTRMALLSDERTAPLTTARLLAGAGRNESAAEAFQLAVTLDAGSPGSVLGTPNEAPARVQLAGLLTAIGRPEDAIAEIGRLLDGAAGSPADPAPAVAAAALVLQKALRDLERGSEVVGRLAALRDRYPDNPQLAVTLAAARAEAGDLERAETELSDWTEREPGVWAPLAGVRRLRGDAAGWIDAVAQAATKTGADPETERQRAARDETFRDAVLDAVPPVDPTPPGENDGGLARAKEITRAQLAAAAGRVDEVEAGLRSALARDEDLRFDAYLTLISALNLLDAAEQAAAVAEEALKDDGLDDPALGRRRAEFLAVRAQLHQRAGETDAAVEKLEQAEKLTPANPYFAFQAGVAKYLENKAEDAVRLLDRAVEKSDALPNGGGDVGQQARSLLSALLVRRGEVQRGEDLLVKQLSFTPNDPGTLNDLGYLWADRGKNLARAERMIRVAVASEPDNAAYLDSLGWVLLKRGKAEEARAPLERAAELATKQGQGTDGTIWSHLGDLWQALGEPKQARDAWKAALQQANTAEPKDEAMIRELQKKLGRE
ncbi:MAG: tetratricopeptide repeat protein, partial [Planctomycetota bacterium]